MKEILDQFRLGRHEFENGHLEGIDGIDPYDLFELWTTEAVEKNELEPNAFELGTADIEGQPSSRIVYLKDIIDGEFVFYTNYASQKANDIALNKKVSMLFFWPQSSRQIRIHGICTKISEKTSDAYFASRPRASQIGAWASHQSDVLVSRDELTSRIAYYEEKFMNEVPRPEHWGGYGIKPTYFEFWQGRPSRLHDRLSFQPSSKGWKLTIKNP